MARPRVPEQEAEEAQGLERRDVGVLDPVEGGEAGRGLLHVEAVVGEARLEDLGHRRFPARRDVEEEEAEAVFVGKGLQEVPLRGEELALEQTRAQGGHHAHADAACRRARTRRRVACAGRRRASCRRRPPAGRPPWRRARAAATGWPARLRSPPGRPGRRSGPGAGSQGSLPAPSGGSAGRGSGSSRPRPRCAGSGRAGRRAARPWAGPAASRPSGVAGSLCSGVSEAPTRTKPPLSESGWRRSSPAAAAEGAHRRR